jgi:hypothetical protein
MLWGSRPNDAPLALIADSAKLGLKVQWSAIVTARRHLLLCNIAWQRKDAAKKHSQAKTFGKPMFSAIALKGVAQLQQL